VKNVIFFLMLFSLFLLILSLWGFYSAIRPYKIISVLTPKDLALPYDTINFKTEDNLLLKGWFIPNTNPNAKTIILLHGYPADKGNILSAMAFLHDNYHLLLFDFRHLGESEGWYTTVGKNEVKDLKAAIAYLKTRGINEVGIWGLSLGGAVAIMTAPNAPEIKAMIVESPYARLDWMAEEYYSLPILKYPLVFLTRLWGKLFLGYDMKDVSPAKEAAKISIPILLIHSEKDGVVSYQHALLIKESLSKNPRAKFIFLKEGAHGELMEDHQQVVEKFFEENL
jgi:pimeloyl-ACP methyl ester carboxylesterase